MDNGMLKSVAMVVDNGMLKSVAMVVETSVTGAEIVLSQIRDSGKKTINFVQTPRNVLSMQDSSYKWLVLCGSGNAGIESQWFEQDLKMMDMLIQTARNAKPGFFKDGVEPAQHLEEWMESGALVEGTWRIGVTEELIQIFREKDIPYRVIPPNEL